MTDSQTDRTAANGTGPVRPPLAPPSIAGEPVVRTDGEDGPDLIAPVAAPDVRPVVGSAQPLAVSVDDAPPVPGAGMVAAGGRVRVGDRVFVLLTSGSALFVVLLVVLVGIFLLVKSVPSIAHDHVNFLTSDQWDTKPGELAFGISSLLWVTVIISLIAMVIAVPIAIGIGLFITQYAPARLARPVAYVIDLLAAIPSIIYGIWGFLVLAPALAPVHRVLGNLDFIPLLKLKNSTGTILDGGIVLSVMILPIVTAISRDVFERTPRANIEAALALGATKWEMIRLAVLPYGRPGVISGAMLGLGRALGETIAITLILSKVSVFSFSILNGGETFASKIANNSSEFNNPASTGAYIAAGLVLFVLTFAVNAAARSIVNRRKDFV